MPAHHPTPSEDRTGRSAAEHDRELVYQICVVGHLGAKWAAWFDGLDIANDPDGMCRIRGTVVDQAALHGLLNKVRDIGLPLQSLTQIWPDRLTGSTLPDRKPTNHKPQGGPS